MSYDIYSGIPVPSRRSSSVERPWLTLEVGQCWFEPIAEYGRLRRQASYHKATHGKEFAVRQTEHPETQQEVVGIWRLK